MTLLDTQGRSKENEAHLPVFSFDSAFKIKLKHHKIDWIFYVSTNECCRNQGHNAMVKTEKLIGTTEKQPVA